MAKTKLLVDTDIFIDYLNTGFLASILEGKGFQIHFSVVTKKELLSKQGLKSTEREAILVILRDCRLIPLDNRIMAVYSDLRRKYKRMEKEDALIAASALARKLPLLTRNWKHYKDIAGLTLFKGQ